MASKTTTVTVTSSSDALTNVMVQTASSTSDAPTKITVETDSSPSSNAPNGNNVEAGSSAPTSTCAPPRSEYALTERIFAKDSPKHYGDFRDDLVRDGFALIKGAVPRERAEQYGEQMFKWLEDFGLGYDRNDPKTIHKDFLPAISEKGMCHGYGVAHEKFAWDVRCEPGVYGAFEKVYQTEDIIVSFDAVGFGFPNRADLPPNKPWPHQDQNREKHGFRCLQGLVNILPNGPADGGLIVCKGAHLLSEEFHEQFKDEKDRIWAWTPEWYGFTPDGMKWLEDKGFVWEKVCAEPGDLLLWDSRTPHYNLPSSTNQPRFCVYTCYMPVADCTQEDLIRKKEAFENTKSTTHWPNALHVGGPPVLRDGKPDPYNRDNPLQPVNLNERGYKLTGIPYIEAH